MKPLLFVGLISSDTTRVAFAGSPAYAGIKGAVEVLTRYLAPGLGSRGIAAKVVALGAVFGGGAMPDSSEIRAYVVQITALGRVPMTSAASSPSSAPIRWLNGQRPEGMSRMML